MKRQSHLNFHTIGFYYTLLIYANKNKEEKKKEITLLYEKALIMDESLTQKKNKREGRQKADLIKLRV